MAWWRSSHQHHHQLRQCLWPQVLVKDRYLVEPADAQAPVAAWSRLFRSRLLQWPGCSWLQVLVKDRSVVETADAETRVVSPAGLQAAIDQEVAKVQTGERLLRASC